MSKKKNKGGFFGGLGYLLTSLGAGVAGVTESLIDVVLALGGDITGNHDYAEWVFKDNTVGDWFEEKTEEYNPGGGMSFFSDVFQSIPQSATLLIPYAGVPIFLASATSQGISSAAEKTGDVGVREVGYGVATAAVETALEKVGGWAGKGVKSIGTAAAKTGAKSIGKTTLKTAAKTATRKSIGSKILSTAASEFTEEALSEVADTYLQRLSGVDPNKELSLRDILYSGAVGAVSGTVTTGPAHIATAANNTARGERIIRNGNSQTLVNTATKVADKLAAQGTDWERAPEWVSAIRGQVDAYNNLTDDQKTGTKGKMLLGEMQSSLYFAEHQSTFNFIQSLVQKAPEQQRATWAEHINRTVEKEKRNNKDYTAADVANNTDNIAWQLAIYKYIPTMFNIDAAVAEADAAQESGIADVIARSQGAESGAAVGAEPVAVGAEQYDLKEALTTLGDYDADRRRHIESNPNDKISRNYNEIAEFINTASKQNPVKRLHIGVVNSDVADLAKKKANVDITDYDFVIASNFIAHIFDEHGNEKTEATRGQKAVDKNNIEDIIETVIQPDDVSSTTDNQGNKALKFEKDINGRNVAITITSTKKGTLTLKSAWIINKNSGGRTPPASVNTLAGTSKTSGRSSTDNSIHQNESVVNPEAKEISSDDATDEKGENSRSKADKEKAEETGAEIEEKASGAEKNAAEATAEAEAKPEEKADLEKAKRDAERMIEWEKKNAPTAEELNTVREYVKNFDSLPADRQLAIVRMIRSSKGVDADTVRGVANLMAITNRKGEVLAPDLEFRFAELADSVAKRGIKTEVGGKTVIVLNTNSSYKNTIRGSIAHEIVHYLENRKGYKALADFAMKHAKAEKVAQVRETYKDVYKGENAEAKIESEVVASVVAEMLGSEKFLKRYAQMGEEQGSVIKRIARFVKGIANALKDKDKKASAVATDVMNLVDKALGSEVAREKTGGKASFDISPDEAREWEKPITMDDVNTLRSIGRKSINTFSTEDIKKAQKWAYKFYKELGVKSPFFRAWFGEWRAHDNKTKVTVVDIPNVATENQRSIDGVVVKDTQNNGKAWNVVISGHGERNTRGHSGEKKKSVAGLTNIKELVENAVLFNSEVHEPHDNNAVNDYIAFDHKLYSLGVDESGSIALYRITVEEFYQDWKHPDSKRFHNLKYIEEVAKIPAKKVTENLEGRQDFDESRAVSFDEISATTYSISDLYEFVKTFDKEFLPAPEVSEYMLNEDGTPKVFYHGTEFDFNAFSYEKIGEASGVSILGDGFYFADKNALAKKYGKTVKACYLSMHNPYIATQDDLYGLNSDKLSKQGYDGVILKSPSGNIYMVFDNTQIKSADKAGTEKANIGTFDKSEPDIRYDLDPEAVKKQKKNNEKRSEKLEKENEVLKEKLKKERSLREKMAREEANAAKAERARRYTKKEVAPAVEEIAGLTDEQVKSLAKGFALEGMSGTQKDRIISDIYIALHEASAEGEAGPGSVAVKGIATRIAWDMVQSAKIKGEDGKYYHLVDIYDEASVQAIASEYADVLYERFANMGQHTKYSYFAADLRAVEEEFRRDRIDDNAIHKLSREVSYQGQQLRRLVETQKRGMEDEGIQKVTKILASVVDAKGNIVTSKVDEAIGEADRFYSLQSGMTESQEQTQEGDSLTEFAYSSDANLKFMIDEFKRLRARVDKRGKDRTGKFLDAQEMRLLGKILAGMRKTVTEYNKVFINERYVDIDKVASDGATDIVEYYSLDKKAKTKVGELFNSLMRGVKQSYFYNVLTPETTIEALEGFKIGGVLKTLYHDVRVHKQKAEKLAWQMKEPFAEFLDAKGEIDIPVSGDVAGTDSVSDSDLDERLRVQKNVATFNSAEENTDLLNMISSVEAKKHNDNDKVYFENVSDDIAKIIHQLTGVDVRGFKVAIEARQLEHILNRHGKNGKQDQSLSDNSDIARIESVLKNPDKIRRAGKTKAYSYTLDNKNKTADTVLYEMLLKDKSYYVVQAVPDTKSKTLYIVTAFMGEQGYESKITKGTPQLIDANAPTRTSENDFVVVPKNIIHQSKENVNKKISTIKINPTWKDEKGKKHSFRDKLNKKMITVNGADLTLGEAIYLYMLTKRELSHAGLRENGYIVYDENNQRRLKVKIEDVEAARGEISSKLDDADKAFLKMAEDFFNKTSTEVKNEADMRIFGYTNIEDGYYVPMIRDRYSRMQGVTDQRQSVSSIITVYNKSFNQNTVQNARALEGKNIMSIINDHADGLADYSELYIPLKSFDRVYNKAVIVDGETRSIREILNNEVWNKSEIYLKDLFADIQGQNRKNDNVIDSVVGKLRSAWVNSVLGLNIKVVATQTTSFVAANQVIEAKYLMPAMKKFFGNQSEIGARANEYSDIIGPRSFDMGALKAQGNIDKVMEWSSKTGFMINLMDRRVCLAVFHAAELKAEAQGVGAVGTVENAKAAAKIADEAIYTTQAMTSASERSALQRSKSEIARTLSMFTSDSVKNLSHFVGNIMKYQAHKARAKSDLASKAQYEAELKKDAKAIRRSAKTLVMTGVMLGLITQAFKYLYAKEEEEPKDKAKDFATDIISSTFNILPGVSDIVDKFVFDYDMSLNVFDIANNTIEDTSSLMNMAGQAIKGEYVSGDKVFKNVFNFVKTVGTAFGAPIAPVERTVTGLLRRFFPSAIYGYDAMMSNPSYTADLKKAVESGDEKLAEHILSTLYKNEATGTYSTPELEEVSRLYSLTDDKGNHYNVLPQKIPEEVNGVVLNRKQRKQFEEIYSQASGKVNELIRSDYYDDLSDSQKAKAIKNIYSLYFNRAASEVTGVEWSNAQAYSKLTSNYPALFASQAYKSGLSAYKTPLGEEVSVREQFVEYAQNLRLSEKDLLVILYANGYRDSKTKAALIEYINSLTISSEEKKKVAEKLGFDFKEGKVMEKTEELEIRSK